jgi:hypothetical protein
MRKIFFVIIIALFFLGFKTEKKLISTKAIIDVVSIKKTKVKPMTYIKNDSVIFIEFEGACGAFPVVLSKNRPDVAEKINLMLQITHLSQVPGKYKGNDPFFISNNGFECGYTNFLGYSITHISENIIEITINYEQVYCTGVGFANHSYIEQYDLRTGNKILFSDLFTKNGLDSIKEEVINSFRSQFDGYLSEITKLLKKKSRDESDIKRLNDQLKLYNECKDNTIPEYFNENEFIFSKEGITITRNYCWGNDAERGIDEYSLPTFFLKYKNYTSQLSDYGKYVLGFSEKYSPVTNFENKILRGLIANKYPIKAIFEKIYNDGSTTMKYWSDKAGIPIELFGDFKNNELSLVEYEGVDEEQQGEIPTQFTDKRKYEKGKRWLPGANISAAFVDNKIEGSWTNTWTNEKLDFYLEIY